ncbi:unnamed protein product [Bursaphelenchus okinawaensis]|uniref:Uncharacterized protein n=1 Tax=Bursaphelenchus okinawaensis TaxID=465554 RepID=A0A811L8A3_9BILA|nr:unnamed protein product [Bursaphelenchus okinawaensis]CAG9117666.1 unnamed protein product [Bursaphelenchus okinawaensis]
MIRTKMASKLNCRQCFEYLRRFLISRVGILFTFTIGLCLVVYIIVGVFFPDPRHRFPLASIKEVRKYLDVPPTFKSYVRKRLNYDFTLLEYQYSHPLEYECKIPVVKKNDASPPSISSFLNCREPLVRQSDYGDLFVQPADIKNGRPEFRCFYSDLSDNKTEKYQLREGRQKIQKSLIQVDCYDRQNATMFSEKFLSLPSINEVSNVSNSRFSNQGSKNYSFALLNLNGLSKLDVIFKMPQTVDVLEKFNTHLFNGFHMATPSISVTELVKGFKSLLQNLKDSKAPTLLNSMIEEGSQNVLKQFSHQFMIPKTETPVKTGNCENPDYEKHLDLFKRFLSKYASIPTFSFTNLDLTNTTDLSTFDFRLADVLDKAYLNGAFENTILVLLGQKSIENGNEQPFLGVSLPDSYFASNPEMYSIYRTNKNALVTVDDVYNTVNSIVDKEGFESDSKVTLLQRIGINRTCEEMGIVDDQCHCLVQDGYVIDDELKSRIRPVVTNYILNTLSKLKCKVTHSNPIVRDIFDYTTPEKSYKAKTDVTVTYSNAKSSKIEVQIMLNSRFEIVNKGFTVFSDTKCGVKTLDEVCHCESRHLVH